MNKKPFPDSRDLNQMQGYWFGAFPHTSQWLITPRVHNTKRFQRSSDHTFEKWTSKAYTRQIKAHPSVKSSVRKVNIKTLPVTPQKREKKKSGESARPLTTTFSAIQHPPDSKERWASTAQTIPPVRLLCQITPHGFLQTNSVFSLESRGRAQTALVLTASSPETNKQSCTANAKEKHLLKRPKGAWPLRKRA